MEKSNLEIALENIQERIEHYLAVMGSCDLFHGNSDDDQRFNTADQVSDDLIFISRKLKRIIKFERECQEGKCSDYIQD